MKDQLCVKRAKFWTSHMPIFEYQSLMHEFLLLDSQNFFFFLGGKLPP